MEDGSIFQGEWDTKTNLRDGKGIIIWKNGARYDGFFLKGKANCYGRIIHADGDIYEGEWVNDVVQGYGIQ